MKKKQKKFEKYLNSVVTSHGDMEEDRREIEKNVKKMLELFENSHADVADRSDLVFLVNDIKKRFHSLYGRHDGLIGKIKNKVHQRQGDSSSGTSDSGAEDSSDDDGTNNIHEPKIAQQISLEDYQSVWDQFDSLSKRNAELEAQSTSMQAKLEESQCLADDLAEREILITKLENELQTVSETLKAIEAKNEFLKTEIDKTKEQEGKLSLLLRDLQEENEVSRLEKENISSQLLEAHNSVTELENELEKRIEETGKVRGENSCLRVELDKTAQEVAHLNQQIVVVSEEQESLQTLAAELKLANDNLISEKAALLSENLNMKDQQEASSQQVANLNDRLLMIEGENDALKSEVLSLSTHMHEAHNSVTELKNELEKRIQETVKVRDENSCLRVELDKTAQEVAHLNQQIVVVSEEHESLQTLAAELKLANDNLISEKAALLFENLNMKDQQDASTQQVANLNDRLLMIEGEHDALKSEVLSLSTHMHEADKTMKDMTIGSGFLKEDISKLNDIINELNNQLKVKDDEKNVIELESLEACKVAKHAEERVARLSAEIERMKIEYSLLLTGHGNLKQELEFSNQELSKIKQAMEAIESERNSLIEEKSVLLTKYEKLKLDMEGNTRELSKIKQAMEATESERNSLIEENSVLLTKYENLKLDMEGNNKELSTIKQDMEAAESERNSLIEENSALLTKYENLTLGMESNNQELSKIKQAMEATKSERNSLIEDNSVILTQYENLKLDMEGNNQELSKIKQAMEATESERNSLIEEKSALLSKIDDGRIVIDGLKTHIEELGVEISQLRLNISNLDHKFQATNAQLTDVKDALLASEEERKALVSQNSVFENNLQEAEFRSEGLLTELEKLNEKISILQSKIVEVEKAANDLNFERDGLVAFNAQLEIKVQELIMELGTANARLNHLEKLKMATDDDKANFKSEISMLSGKLHQEESDNEKREREIDLLREENTALKQNQTELGNKMVEHEKRLEHALSEMQHLKDILEQAQNEVSHEVHSLFDTFKSDIIEMAYVKGSLDHELKNLAEITSENEVSLKKMISGLSSKISDYEALLKNYEELLTKHNQLEDSYFESCVKLETAEKRLEEMEMKEQIIQRLDGLCLEQKKEIRKLDESYRELLEKLSLTEVGKIYADKEIQRLEVALRLSNQKLKITETEYKEKEEGWKALNKGLQNEIKLLDRQVLMWSEKFTVLNNECRQLEVLLQAGMESLADDLHEMESTSLENIEHVTKQVTECVAELLKMQALLESELHKKKKLETENHELEVKLRDKEGIVSKLKDESSLKGAKLAEKEKEVVILEMRFAEWEKNLKQKEREVLDMGEEKREAIRQLCLLIEYHWENCNHLVKYLSSAHRSRRAS